MNECHLAAGDTLTLARLPALSWEVTRRWQSVGDDFVTVDWVEVYHPTRGSFLVRWGDPAETLYTAPKPADVPTCPVR